MPQALWKLKSSRFQPHCSSFTTVSIPKHPQLHQHHLSSTISIHRRSTTIDQLMFLTMGSSCLLSSSLTKMWLMVDVPYVSTDKLLQCCTLMQPLEEQQRKDVLVKQMQQREKKNCPSNVYFLTPTHNTLLP